MNTIWYLLKCPKGKEDDYTEQCQKLAVFDGSDLQQVICFEYQRMLRYGGRWHMERKKLFPGWIFLSGTRDMASGIYKADGCWIEQSISLIPCQTPYMKHLCQGGNVIRMSRGMIKEGKAVITSGPLKGQERLIRRIDRHKRTAEIEIPFVDKDIRVTVGLEIYEKQQ